MKSLFSWMRKNPALSFFFGAEIACLLLGFAMVVKLQFKDIGRPGQAVAQVMVIAEKDQRDLVQTAMEVFTQSQDAEYKLISATREKAIDEFSKNERAILILSRQLDEKEIASLKISPKRLPLSQEPIDRTAKEDGVTLIFVRDNLHSVDEDKIAGFLSNNASQDLVYQKHRAKTAKRSVKG